jgi:hypothetical protein
MKIKDFERKKESVTRERKKRREVDECTCG